MSVTDELLKHNAGYAAEMASVRGFVYEVETGKLREVS